MFYFNKVVEDNMSRTELEHVVKVSVVFDYFWSFFLSDSSSELPLN